MAKGRNILAVATLLALSTTALLGHMGATSGSHRLRAPLHDAMPWGPPDGVSSLDYHGGPTLTTSTSYAIFWAPRGSSFETSGSSTYQSLITRYLSDVGGSPLYGVVTQYYRETSNARRDIRNTSSLGGVYVDSSPYPEAATTAHPLRDREIQTEILRVMRVTGWRPTAGHVFFVYTTDRAQSCIGNGRRQCSFNAYCAYHSSFRAPDGQIVVYAALPDASRDTTHCLARDGGKVLSPNLDPIADAEVSITSHEQFEMVTDPQVGTNTAWIDSSGDEVADKCVGSYGQVSKDGSNVILHGHPYIVQQEFSNSDGGCVTALGQPSQDSSRAADWKTAAPDHMHLSAKAAFHFPQLGGRSPKIPSPLYPVSRSAILCRRQFRRHYLTEAGHTSSIPARRKTMHTGNKTISRRYEFDPMYATHVFMSAQERRMRKAELLRLARTTRQASSDTGPSSAYRLLKHISRGFRRLRRTSPIPSSFARKTT